LTEEGRFSRKTLPPLTHESPQAAERRRHKRAQIEFRVHVRGGIGTQEAFEDLCRSLDVTRDGVLLRTSRGGYWAGQPLQVTCPYWSTPIPINTARKARVIRSWLLPDSRYGVAIEFQQMNGNGAVQAAARPFPNQVRVLGVESDARMARAMQNLLEQDGYNVVFVATAQQALDILGCEEPDVLLAEVEGNGISGHDLCAIVKTDERLRHIPVILLTKSALPSDYSASYKLGAVVCISKPCQPERVQHAVHLVAPPPAQCTVYSARFNMGAFVRTS
jgi:CheY-like chemotaxis protein